VWYEEEIECAIDYFGLLHESAVNVGTLRRVANSSICTGHLEKSLSYSLVNDDESMLGVFLILVLIETIFLKDNFLKLLKLVINNLLSH
jgi:hypothetical protein